MNAACQRLSSLERWSLYLVVTGLPGLIICIVFGFGWSLLFEAITWVPQQRFFDHLELAKTLPFQDER